MAYKVTRISQDPLGYFLDHAGGNSLRVSDVILRANQDPKEVFAHLIRIATASKWSHSAIVYLTSDPEQGFNNTFLVEAKTKGINLASWRNEVVPFDEFNVGIKRPILDWYVETPYEAAHHRSEDPEDTHGIAYLRHVRGIAIGLINDLYDHKTVYELSALYAARAARRHLGAVPQVADAAVAVANMFKKWDEADTSATSMLNFICSGLVQYSFFEALRWRIMKDLDIPAHREAALSNLRNLHRIIYREDPEQVIEKYIQQVKSGQMDIHKPAPDDVMDLLKTATPADFNNSANLEWHYVIRKGVVWQVETAPVDYPPQGEDEKKVLEMIESEHFSDDR